MSHVYIITHTDLDGVGSAAAILRTMDLVDGGATILYAEPYNVDEKLDSISEYVEEGDRVVVADLGPNRDSFNKAVESIRDITGRGAEVEWYDHHVWSEDEEEALRRAGARLFIDKSTCATGVVARYATSLHGAEVDEVLRELESIVCAADLWRWDHPMAPKLARIVGWNSDEERDEWRSRVAYKLAQGIFWDDEFEERLQDYVTKELSGYNKVMRTIYVKESGKCRVAAAYKLRGPPANSFIGGMLQSRYQADIAVIIRPNGGVSLRSRSIDVQIIAKAMGGGGHPRAAGAKISFPLWVRLFNYIYPKAYSRYTAGLVYKIAVKTRSC